MLDKQLDSIIFPIYCLLKAPYSVSYNDSCILVKKRHDGKEYVANDKNLIKSNYFETLTNLETVYKENRLTFDITCLNKNQLVISKSKWGIDNLGEIYDFSKSSKKVPFKCKKIVKIVNNLFWIDSISYPYKIEDYLSEVLNKDLYAYCVKINGEWYIKEFSYDEVFFDSITI